MVLLVNHKCPVHGDVFARYKHGPCPHCEHNKHHERLITATKRVEKHRPQALLAAEVEELRRIVIGTDPRSLADYYERLADTLDKQHDEATRFKPDPIALPRRDTVRDVRPPEMSVRIPRRPGATKQPPTKKR